MTIFMLVERLQDGQQMATFCFVLATLGTILTLNARSSRPGFEPTMLIVFQTAFSTFLRGGDKNVIDGRIRNLFLSIRRMFTSHSAIPTRQLDLLSVVSFACEEIIESQLVF